MGLNIGQVFPQVPTNVSPSDVPNPVPNEDETTLGEVQPPSIESSGQIQSVPEPAPAEEDAQFPGAIVQDTPRPGQVEAVPIEDPSAQKSAIASFLRGKITDWKSITLNRKDSRFEYEPISQDELDVQMSLLRIKDEMTENEKNLAQNVSEEDEEGAIANDVEQLMLDISGKTFAPEGTRPEGLKANLINFMLRLVGSLGLTKEEAIRPLVQAYGPENVTQRKGELYYRERKGKHFIKYDESDVTIADFIADNFGAIVEMGISIPVELGMLSGATALIGSGVGATAGVGLAASAPAVGATAGVAARRALFPDRYQSEDAEIGSEIASSIGMSYAVPWAIKGLGKGSKWIGQKLKGALESSPKIRAKAIAESMVDLEDSVKFLGREAGDAPGSLTTAAKEGFGVVEKIQKDLGTAVGAIKKDVYAKAGDEAFEPSFGLKKFKEILEDNNILFKKNGEAVFYDPNAVNIDDVFIGDDGLLVLTDIEKNVQRKLTQEQFTKEFGLGAKGGNVLLNRMVNHYNKILRKVNVDGGVQAKNIQDVVDLYGDMAQFGKDATGNSLGAKEKQMSRILRNAFAEDRNNVFSQVLGESTGPEGKLWRDVFDEFSSKKADFNVIRKLFNNKDTALDFGREVFKKKEYVDAFKKLVGEGSPEWKNVRNEWLLDTFRQAKDPTSGIFLEKKWAAKFKKLEDNKELLSSILSTEELASVKRLTKNVGDIPFTDLVTPAKTRNIIQDFVRIGIADHLMPQTRAEILWGWFGKNIDLTDEMLSGLMDEARKAPTKAAKNRIFDTISRLNFFKNNSKIITQEIRNPVSKKLEKVRSYVPLGTAGVQLQRFAGQLAEEAISTRSGEPSRRAVESVQAEQGLNARQQRQLEFEEASMDSGQSQFDQFLQDVE